jgi:hypothetical protein
MFSPARARGAAPQQPLALTESVCKATGNGTILFSQAVPGLEFKIRKSENLLGISSVYEALISMFWPKIFRVPVSMNFSSLAQLPAVGPGGEPKGKTKALIYIKKYTS